MWTAPLGRTVALATAVLAAQVAPLLAQQVAPDDPAASTTARGGLFGLRQPERGHAVWLTLGSFGAYDDRIDQRRGGVDGSPVRRGVSGALDGSLTYQKTGEKHSIRWSGATAARVYRDVRDLSPVSYTSGLDIDAPLGRRTRIRLTGSGHYLPYFEFSGLADAELEAIRTGGEIAYGVSKQRAYGYAGKLQLVRSTGRRSSLSFAASHERTEFESARMTDLVSYRAGAAFTRPITRYLGLRAGYAAQEYEFESDAARSVRRLHDLDLGLSYHRSLSITRRAAIAFGSGSLVTHEGDRFRYHARGSASLRYELGRTWLAEAAYTRGLQIIEGLHEPGFADQASLRLGGALGRRADLSLAGAYSVGELGLSGSAPEYRTYTASGRLRVALSARVQAYFRYRFTGYELPIGALPAGARPARETQHAYAGVTAVLPLFTRSR